MKRCVIWCAAASLAAGCVVSEERPAKDDGDEQIVGTETGEMDSTSDEDPLDDSSSGDEGTATDTGTVDTNGTVDSGSLSDDDVNTVDTGDSDSIDTDLPTDSGPAYIEPPEIIAAVPADGSISVQWYETDGAATYNVYFKESSTTVGPNDYTNVIEGIPAGLYKSSHVIEGLENGTTYAVAVTGAYGSVESSFSAVLTAVPTAPLTVPDAPTGVVVIGTDDGEVTLRWNPVEGADSYTIYYRTGGDFDSAAGADGSSAPIVGANQGIADGLPNAVLHYFRVTASNSKGESALSPVAVIGAADPAVKVLELGQWVQGRLTLSDVDGDWLRLDGTAGASYRLYAESDLYHPVQQNPAPTLDLRLNVLRTDKTTVYEGLARTGVSEYQTSIPFQALDDTVWILSLIHI